MVNDDEMIRGRNFKQFKTSVGCSRFGMVGQYPKSMHTDVTQYFKDRGFLPNV